MKPLCSTFLKTIIFLAISLGAFTSSSQAAESKLQVLTSIEPLALIAKELLADKAEVSSLLKSGASPHQYALKPSDAVALHRAHVIIWVGPGLETFMEKSLKQARGQVLQLDQLEQLSWTKEGHFHGKHWQRDAHIWLNPNNVAHIATAIAAQLTATNRPVDVDQRLQLFLSKLEQKQNHWKQRLGSKQAQALMVYHNGYQHLANGLDLTIKAWVSRGEGQSISVKKRWQLQRMAKAERFPCLLAEPYGEKSQAVKFSRSLKLPIVWLDPLAAQKPYPGYMQWMDSQVDSLVRCYQGQLDSGG